MSDPNGIHPGIFAALGAATIGLFTILHNKLSGEVKEKVSKERYESTEIAINARFDEGEKIFSEIRNNIEDIKSSIDRVEGAVYIIVRTMAPQGKENDEITTLCKHMTEARTEWARKKN